MRRFSFLISKYVLQAILPYFVFTWLLLSVILFVQQAGRHSDLLFSTAIPSHLIWQLTFALVPTVISFTCPIAILVGVIIGLSRMQRDSEMIALRASGVGNLQISASIVVLGIFLSCFAFFINIKGVPFAAQIVRRVALQAALNKLESPIEPGVFNTEIAGYTVYVKEGNPETGLWENIFIFQEDKSKGQTRLITAREGRIDTKEDDSEIVLSKTSITTFEDGEGKKVATESLEDFRLMVQTKRGELIEKLSKTKQTPEEMGLTELALYAQRVEGRERVDAQILWQRRILLSITPLLFALLGAALVSKFNRGGRGFGVFLALVSLVVYYLLALLGEQLARTGSITVPMSGLIPLGASIVAIVWFFVSQRLFITRSISVGRFLTKSNDEEDEITGISRKNTYIDLTTGILDLDLVWNLIKNYAVALGFLTSIFLIFTAFELWKFAGTTDNGVALLGSYLFFLLPFIYIQISPSALMIATLATYIIKSRQNEIVTWTAAGRSIYRLLLPCFIFMIVVGTVNFGIQEWVLTGANRKQDGLRVQIRNRNATVSKKGVHWVAEGDKIYSFEKTPASDNDKQIVENLTIFEFSPKEYQLQKITKVDKARWINQSVEFLSADNLTWVRDEVESKESGKELQKMEGLSDPFDQIITKPSHLNIVETAHRVENSKSASDQRIYSISLYKKYATPFLPFIITLFTAPFALSLSRKGNVLTLGYAIAIWLLFMGITGVFEQFGASGNIPPFLSVWGPLLIFTVLGLYLLAKIRT